VEPHESLHKQAIVHSVVDSFVHTLVRLFVRALIHSFSKLVSSLRVCYIQP